MSIKKKAETTISVACILVVLTIIPTGPITTVMVLFSLGWLLVICMIILISSLIKLFEKLEDDL